MITRIAVFTLMATSLAFAADPFVGTWKPDLEKSKYITPGPPETVRTRSMKIESTGKDSYRITFYTPDGKLASTSLGNPSAGDQVFDGNEHDRNGSKFIGSRVDERHIHSTAKTSKGSVVDDDEVSPDGRTLTMTRKGTGPTSGRPVDEILVYTKQ